MAGHLTCSIKAFVAFLYAVYFVYLLTPLITRLAPFDSAGITQLIRSGLCTSSFTQDWAGSVWSCKDTRGARDGFVHVEDVSFFTNGGAAGATLVRTTKTKDGVTVDEIPSVTHAAYELLRICQKVERPLKRQSETQMHGLNLLKDVCPFLAAHIARNMPDKTLVSDTDDTWELVRVLLSTVGNVKGVAVTKFLSRLEVAHDKEHTSPKQRAGDQHIINIMRPVVTYLAENAEHRLPAEKITSSKLIKTQSPLSHVAQYAIPTFLAPALGGAKESVIRLFTTFPEAAAMFIFAIQRKLASYPRLAAATVEDRLVLLGIFIASLQVMTTTTFDSLDAFANIASKTGVDWTSRAPLDEFWDLVAKDKRSRALVFNMLRRAEALTVDPEFFGAMTYNVEIAARVTDHVLATYGLKANTPLERSSLIENVVYHMVQMCRFCVVDADNTGNLSLQEFIGTLMGEEDAKVFREHVSQVSDQQYNLFVRYNFDFINGRVKMAKLHNRKALEAINEKYNEVLDTFMVVDTDASGEVSLEEFIQHAYVTTPLTALDMTR
ncbi:membrane protein, putative [Babesia bigemina]|uniref:Membrane protein, putative n=1 Tax=Babesia bigemina TaxID=5866 RepID=A0A061D8U7_BABBI|nr:membrane protein, putative [Babesia bigemina]CDR97136.1 membrane protein, putative [Babesia bigemina]|eukprot:XP_012769322.1 membrane protein, putative [Babesia bigemina]